MFHIHIYKGLLSKDKYEHDFESLKKTLTIKNDVTLNEILSETETIRLKKNLIKAKFTSMKSQVRRFKENEENLDETISALRQKYHAKLVHCEYLKKQSLDETMGILVAKRVAVKKTIELKLKRLLKERKLLGMNIEYLTKKIESEEALCNAFRKDFLDKEECLLALKEEKNEYMNKIKEY